MNDWRKSHSEIDETRDTANSLFHDAGGTNGTIVGARRPRYSSKSAQSSKFVSRNRQKVSRSCCHDRMLAMSLPRKVRRVSGESKGDCLPHTSRAAANLQILVIRQTLPKPQSREADKFIVKMTVFLKSAPHEKQPDERQSDSSAVAFNGNASATKHPGGLAGAAEQFVRACICFASHLAQSGCLPHGNSGGLCYHSAL